MAKQQRYILGIHSGINASAAIGTADGQLLYAVQEERLSGVKNHIGFPARAITSALRAVGAPAESVELVAHGSRHVWTPELSKDQFLALLLRAHERQRLRGRLRRRIHAVRHRPESPLAALGRALEPVGLRDTVVRLYDHHSVHGAAAFFGLRKDDHPYLVLTCDGQGDGASATVAVYEGAVRSEVARTSENDSLGLPYMWTTLESGFMPHEDEYKLMGMAPYASPRHAAEVATLYRSLVWLDEEEPMRFKEQSGRGFFAVWPEFRERLRGRRFDHVFGGLQLFTEDALTAWTSAAVAATGVNRVLAAGGVFMNVKANQAIAGLHEVSDFEVFPSCGDESLSIGAYYMAAAERKANVGPLSDYFLGDDVGTADVDTCNVVSRSYADTASVTADLLAHGEIVARCVGRMEFGARALGHRSILAPAHDLAVVGQLNRAIKRRDFWMPFAPAMLAERSAEYLDAREPRSPFMMKAFDTTPTSVEALRAAVHPADRSARAQIVYERENPDLYRVLKEYERRTGHGVVLNTSFNLHGEPIVRTAADAIRVFHLTELKHLTLPRLHLSKAE